MVRGWVSGLVMGGLVGVTGLSVVSLVADPKAAGPERLPPEASAAEQVAAAPAVTPPSAPAAQAPVAPAPAEPATPAPSEPVTPAQQVPPAPAPEALSPFAPQAPVAPVADAPAPAQLATPEAVVVPAAPQAPVADGGAAAMPDAPPPAASAPSPGASAEAPAPPPLPADAAAAPDAGLTGAQAPEAGAAPAALPPAPLRPAAGAEAAPVAADLPALPPLTAEEEALLKRLGDGSADAAPEVTDPAPLPEVAVVEPAPEPEPEPEPEPAPDAAEVPSAGGDAGPVPDPALAPVAGLGGAVKGVTSDRLPRIGDAAQADPAVQDAALAGADPRPLVRFARRFENPGQKPLYAIILVDTGGPEIDRAALARLPFAVSFALDPLDPGAAAAAAIYRAGGQEVLLLATGIPSGAQAQDLEVAFGVMGDALPEAVAVLDTAGGAFQGDRPLASLVVPLVAAQGRGLVTWDRGLNAADQVARREGVPAAVAFRSLDAEGETAPVIRRYLDRAAFKAAQEGRVTVIGSTRPETIAALLEWAVEGRSATVALAPVSAVLTVP